MRKARPFAAALVGFLSAACATTRYTQSGFVPSPADAKSRAGSSVSLEIEGLRLRVETLDRAPLQEAIPPLALQVVFDPRELGYSFDPGQVVLRCADGRESRAPGGQYLPIYPKARFDLEFDAVVPADSSLELVLAGLARGQVPLRPVTLRLARHRGRSIDRVYWLEILLAPLAYAP